VPFVGMEPAVKPAVEQTKTGVVGVLATPATFQGALYASVIERFASSVTVLQHTCPGLVGQIEKGAIDAPETRAILEDALLPMLARGIDTVVLGCTHYPFAIPLIQAICGEAVRVIDPAPAIARQVRRVLESRGITARPGKKPGVQFFTTGQPQSFQSSVKLLLNENIIASQAAWVDLVLK
jgi:glutamate racemase